MKIEHHSIIALFCTTSVGLFMGCADDVSGSETMTVGASESGDSSSTTAESGDSSGATAESGHSSGASASSTDSGDGDSNGGGSESESGEAPQCGDGVLDLDEECDLGVENSDTGECTTACALATCDDGLLHLGEESDVDCGGSCPACDEGDACITADDCALAYCVDGLCGYASSCLELAAAGNSESGHYTIDPDGEGPADPVVVTCDMVTDGGGWTLLSKTAAGAGGYVMGGPPVAWFDGDGGSTTTAFWSGISARVRPGRRRETSLGRCGALATATARTKEEAT